MKRIVNLCLSMVIIMALCMTAFAAEFWDESAGNGTSQVYGHIYSSYTIKIPATIDLRNGEQGSVTIENGNIESGYAVNIYCTNIGENGIRLNHVEKNTSVECALMSADGLYHYDSITPFASFTNDDIAAQNTTKYFKLEIIDRWMSAGDYVGTMEYSFRCEPIAP